MPGGTGPGGAPVPGPGNVGNIGGLSGTDWRPAYRSALSAIYEQQRSAASTIPPIAASINGQARDYLSRAVGLLRFGANVQGFEFVPSIAIVAKDLRALANGLTKYRVPLERVVREVLMPSIWENFLRGGRPPWEPLDPDTTQRKHRNRYLGLTPQMILIRTGKLRAAATSFSIWSINEVSAVVKDLPDNVKYGYVHQEGYGQTGAAKVVGGSGSIGGRKTGGKGTADWFKPYLVRARMALGPKAFSDEVEYTAWKLFDRRHEMPGQHIGFRQIVIPQRRFIMWQDEDMVKAQEIFYEWMDVEIVRLGKFYPGM